MRSRFALRNAWSDSAVRDPVAATGNSAGLGVGHADSPLAQLHAALVGTGVGVRRKLRDNTLWRTVIGYRRLSALPPAPARRKSLEAAPHGRTHWSLYCGFNNKDL